MACNCNYNEEQDNAEMLEDQERILEARDIQGYPLSDSRLVEMMMAIEQDEQENLLYV